jgi:hypothetical protein
MSSIVCIWVYNPLNEKKIDKNVVFVKSPKNTENTEMLKVGKFRASR